jgi:Tol biopolymer transport system component
LPICGKGSGAGPEELTLTFAAEWDGDLEIYSIQADGSGLTQLTSNSSDELDPAWSPDGKQLAYVELRNTEEQLFVVDANGQHGRLLVPESLGPIVHPTWSPAGDKIAFRNLEDLYVVDVQTGEALNLTERTRPFPGDLSFSADGSMLAFNAQSDVDPAVNNKLFVINVDGTGLREFTHPSDGGVRNPMWHPSQDRILFWGFVPTEGFPLYLASLDGTIDELPLQATPAALLPAWSPDGSMIAYIAHTFDALHVLAADEALDIAVLELADEAEADTSIWRFFWAPDNRHIAYLLSEGPPATVVIDLYVLDVCDGTSVPVAEAVFSYSSVSWKPLP